MFILPFQEPEVLNAIFKKHCSLLKQARPSQNYFGRFEFFLTSQSPGYFLFEAGALVFFPELNFLALLTGPTCLLLKLFHD